MRVSDVIGKNMKNTSWEEIQNKPEKFAPSQHNHNALDINTDENHRFITDAEKTKLNNSAVISDEEIITNNTWSSKKISDEIKKISAFTFKKTISNWERDIDSNLFKTTVDHNLNTKDIIITSYNTISKLNELISYKILNENSIEIIAEDQDQIDITIYSNVAPIKEKESNINIGINDNKIESTSTWSSNKINEELNSIKQDKSTIKELSDSVASMSTNVNKIPTIESSTANIKKETDKIPNIELSIKNLSTETSKINGIENNITTLQEASNKIPTMESSIKSINEETKKIPTITSDIDIIKKDLQTLKSDINGNKEAVVNNINNIIDSI